MMGVAVLVSVTAGRPVRGTVSLVFVGKGEGVEGILVSVACVLQAAERSIRKLATSNR